jgi:hypothetical protein
VSDNRPAWIIHGNKHTEYSPPEATKAQAIRQFEVKHGMSTSSVRYKGIMNASEVAATVAEIILGD